VNITCPRWTFGKPAADSRDKTEADLEDGAKTLEETLRNFGVDTRVAHVEQGPVLLVMNWSRRRVYGFKKLPHLRMILL